MQQRAKSILTAVTVTALLVAGGVAVVLISRAARGPTYGGQGTAMEQAKATLAPGVVTAADALKAADSLIVNAKWPEAIKELRKAAMAFPTDQALRVQLANALQGAERWSEARAELEEAITIGPASASMHIQAGTLANKAGELDKAVAHYQEAQRLEPNEPRHPLYLGMIQLKQGQEDAAIASLYRATRLDEHLGEAWGTMAEIELRRNNTTIALQHIEHAREAQPEFLRWRLVQSRVYRRMGQPHKSVDLLVNLPQSDRLAPATARELADAFSMLGRHAEAVALLEQAALAAAFEHKGALFIDAARAAERGGDIDMAKSLAAQALSAGNQQAAVLIADLSTIAPPPPPAPAPAPEANPK